MERLSEKFFRLTEKYNQNIKILLSRNISIPIFINFNFNFW